MQTKGLFQTLAEPNLVAESGKEASFLAGGEFPVPIAQPGANGTYAVTVVFKEFGIRLNFTPVVNGNRVHLKVRPEVSTLDFANAVTLSGFRIPALSTRRAETELELDNHQTFAIAGLLDNSVSNTMQKIPGIGDIPILGELFKSRSNRKDKTELVVMITPEILEKGSHGVTSELPRTPSTYLGDVPEKNSFPAPPPAFEPRPSDADMDAAAAIKAPKKTPAPTAAPAAPAKKNDDPAAAAAAVSALTPASRPVNHADPVVSARPIPEAAPAAPAAEPVAKEKTAEVKQDAAPRQGRARADGKARKESSERARRSREEGKSRTTAPGEARKGAGREGSRGSQEEGRNRARNSRKPSARPRRS